MLTSTAVSLVSHRAHIGAAPLRARAFSYLTPVTSKVPVSPGPQSPTRTLRVPLCRAAVSVAPSGRAGFGRGTTTSWLSTLDRSDATAIRRVRSFGSSSETAAPVVEGTGYTPAEEVPAIVATLRAAASTGETRSLEWRRDQLNAMDRLLEENREAFYDALESDLKRDEWGKGVEFNLPVEQIKYFQDNLAALAAPSLVMNPIVNPTQPSYGKLLPEPLGTVMVIGPWNYPLHCLLTPAVAALAAGNNVVLKPSEVSPAVGGLLTRLVPQYFSDRAVAVVYGGIPETTAALKERFDKICYTGNGMVGKIVMAAASQHLCPVLLELGGKSPTYVDASANLEVAARRILWGKVVNAGQTCVAPDYLLVHKDVKERFTELLLENLNKFYPDGARESPDYARIVAQRHVDRIQRLITPAEAEGGKFLAGGAGHEHLDHATKYIAPALIDFGADTGAFEDSTVMSEEIFGPVFPMCEVSDVDEACALIKRTGEKPLAIYCFSDSATFSHMMNTTSSGMATNNDCVINGAAPTLPFGGVGESGMGSYNNQFGFKTFSHLKPILVKPPLMGLDGLIDSTLGMLRYPPVAAWKLKTTHIAFAGRNNWAARALAEARGWLARKLLG